MQEQQEALACLRCLLFGAFQMQAEEYLEEEHGEEYEEPPAEEQFEEARRVCMYVCVCVWQNFNDTLTF